MVDAEIKATGVIFLVDFAIFCGYVLLWFAIRGTRGDKGVVLPNWKSGRQDLNQARFTMRDLRPSVSEELPQDNSQIKQTWKNPTFLEDEQFSELERHNKLQIRSVEIKSGAGSNDLAFVSACAVDEDQ